MCLQWYSLEKCELEPTKLLCMKKFLLVLACILFAEVVLSQNTVPYNVVFDLTSKDTNVQKSVLRWMQEISNARPDAKLEVVLYGQSLDLVRTDRSTLSAPLQKILSNPNLTVAVCAAAMKRHGVDSTLLYPKVKIVDDGIYEIIQRQSQGWGYIKAGQ
jgi:uncharacterized protein